MYRRLLLIAALVCAAPSTGSAQVPHVQTAIVPSTITVGDVFHAAVRISPAEPGAVQAPDSLTLPPDLENAGPREIRYDEQAGSVTIIYPLAAWRPGSYDIADITVAAAPDLTVPRTAGFPAFRVSSVLPADTAGIEPQPAKDVLGGTRVWWPFALLLLVLLAAAIAAWLWWRRRRGEADVMPIASRLPPWERARAELEALRAENLPARGEVKQFYERLTATLRSYAAEIEPGWSDALTTNELEPRIAQRATAPEAWNVVHILRDADLVKFARAQRDAGAANRHLDEAAQWVEAVSRSVREQDRSAA